MKLPRRQFLHLAAGAAALPAVSPFAWAQAWPTQPVTLVVPFAAGGGTDVVARIVAPRLSDLLGQQLCTRRAECFLAALPTAGDLR
jgi:tripartite-type tricarboxylate transporter receptor subunit TctC